LAATSVVGIEGRVITRNSCEFFDDSKVVQKAVAELGKARQTRGLGENRQKTVQKSKATLAGSTFFQSTAFFSELRLSVEDELVRDEEDEGEEDVALITGEGNNVVSSTFEKRGVRRSGNLTNGRKSVPGMVGEVGFSKKEGENDKEGEAMEEKEGEGEAIEVESMERMWFNRYRFVGRP
jgi:hypothetical protein